jgi:putative pyrroloquinoline-quinone binding quinoprotein
MQRRHSIPILIVLLLGSTVSVFAGGRPPSVRWSARVEHGALFAASAKDGTTVVGEGGEPRIISLLDGATGRVNWNRRSAGDGFSGVVLSANGDRILLTDSTTVSPGSEWSDHRALMLDREGRVLWTREVPGPVSLSATGEYLLAHDRHFAIGLHVFRGRDGALLWRLPPEQLGHMEAADFTADGKHILVHVSGKALLFTVTGDLVWSLGGLALHWVATSADGGVTALLYGVKSRKLLIVDRVRSGAAGVELLRFDEEGLPPEGSGWTDVTVARDGRLVLVRGHTQGREQVKAFDRNANPLWELDLPAPGVSVEVSEIASGLFAVSVETEAGTTTVHLVDGTGALRGTLLPPGPLPSWTVSEDGALVTAIVDSQILLFPAPRHLARAPDLSTRKVARAPAPKRWAWVSLRGSLRASHWVVTEKPGGKEILAASKDGRRRLRLKLGSRYASLNGSRVVLPAAPRKVGKRVEVPSTLLPLLAGVRVAAAPGQRPGAWVRRSVSA